uniref:Uncharacterized protein n=1 Tax=Salmo trutta TaxID=8032 RepID=A0A673YJ05_SALTR
IDSTATSQPAGRKREGGREKERTGEERGDGPVHHWGQASCHPGPLYQAVSEESPKNCQRLQPP